MFSAKGRQEGCPHQALGNGQPDNSQRNVEPLTVDNDDGDASFVALRKAKPCAEFLAPDIREEGPDSADIDNVSHDAESPLSGNQRQASNFVELEKPKQNVEYLATSELSLATNNSGSDKWKEANQSSAAESPEAGHKLEALLMPLLLEERVVYESGPLDVQHEELGEQELTLEQYGYISVLGVAWVCVSWTSGLLTITWGLLTIDSDYNNRSRYH